MATFPGNWFISVQIFYSQYLNSIKADKKSTTDKNRLFL